MSFLALNLPEVEHEGIKSNVNYPVSVPNDSWNWLEDC